MLCIHFQVVEVVSSAISELMEAEFSGLTDKNGMATVSDGITMEDWEHQTYLASGSLLAKSCKSALHLANHTSEMQQQAFDFGLNMAYAHQVRVFLNSGLLFLTFLKPLS